MHKIQGSGPAVPVVMYHTVGRIMPDWKWSYLTVPAQAFEDHLRWLVKSGYQTIDLDQLYLHVTGEQPLSARSVVMTFDDGYLDNWTHVAPLLKKYGCKGTVFVNPDFVDPCEVIRPTLEDVWAGRMDEQGLSVRGFMSWPELQHLELHGPLRVEAHAMTHTWYPSGPEIVDFHHPDDGHYWLDWNQDPKKKPFYLANPRASVVPLGWPVYAHQKSLAVRQYFPDPEEGRKVAEFVRQHGGTAFFAEFEWRERLHEYVTELREENQFVSKQETEEEQLSRFRYEMQECKKILASKLGREPKFLCWPGGGYNELSRALGMELFTAVTLGSSDPSPNRNRPGDNPRLIKRIGVPGMWRHDRYLYPGGRYFIQVLKEYQGGEMARRYRQLQKIILLSLGYILG